MSKIKIFLLTMSIFLVSSISCFADSRSVEFDGKTYKYYAVQNTSYGFKNYYYTNVKPSITTIKDKNDGILFTDVYYRRDGDQYLMYQEKQIVYISQLTDLVGFTIGDGDVSFPEIAPIVPIQITELMTVLSEQLQIFLPTGVTILSLLLGVSLIPRLIYLLV